MTDKRCAVCGADWQTFMQCQRDTCSFNAKDSMTPGRALKHQSFLIAVGAFAVGSQVNHVERLPTPSVTDWSKLIPPT